MNYEQIIQVLDEFKANGGDLNAVAGYASAAASSEPTPFLRLNQWQRSDKPVMEDFNDDNRKIDEGFAALQAENNALRAELAKKADINKVQIQNLPLQSAFSVATRCCYFKTSENVVHVYGSVQKNSGVLANDDLFALMPEGYRINVAEEFPGSTNNGTGNVLLIVRPTGNLMIRTLSGGATANKFYFNFAYGI